MTKYNNFKIIVIRQNGNFSILKLLNKDGKFVPKLIKLSENFSIFSFSNQKSNLPAIYNKKDFKNPLKKILSLFGII